MLLFRDIYAFMEHNFFVWEHIGMFMSFYRFFPEVMSLGFLFEFIDGRWMLKGKLEFCETFLQTNLRNCNFLSLNWLNGFCDWNEYFIVFPKI